MNRSQLLQEIKAETNWDLIVIGGGASGLGTALDAVSRGMKVCLLEKYDFGKGTSSRSTKLVHGGVRYLEQGNIALVKEALQEREYILKQADHLSRVQPFIVPSFSWFTGIYYYIGLKVYDLLSGSKSIGKTTWLSKEKVIAKIPNISTDGLVGGIQYMDGQFDDARLCIDLVKTILHHGGKCINHAGAAKLTKVDGKVVGVTVKDEISGQEFDIKAKYVVNAAGIFTDDIVQLDQAGSKRTIVPSRGSHIVLDRSFLGGEEAIMIPKTSDGRVLFVIPWNGKVVAGTTDEKTDEAVAEPKATEEEISFILANCQQYLNKKPKRKDILTTFAGLRPLAAPKEGSGKTKEISRGHKVLVSPSGLVSIIGGKWTTFRKMGEDVIHKISKDRRIQFPPSKSLSLKIEGNGLYSSADRLHPSLPYSKQDFEQVIREEMPMTIEDVLCRRTRCIFLDAAATEQITPTVGAMLQQHLGQTDAWLTDQLKDMKELLINYKV